MALPVTLALFAWAVIPAIAAPPEGFAELVEKVRPVVVNVTAHIKRASAAEDPPPQKSSPNGRGSRLEDLLRSFTVPEEDGAEEPGGPGEMVASGFIVDKAGYVVTGEHVIRGADRVRIRLADGRKFYARIVGGDDETDLALLKVDTKEPLPAATWEDSDQARVGDWVLAVGNPFGFAGSVSPRTIFIADDDEAMRDSLKVLLETRNFTVVEFASGSEVLRRRDKPDCLILDMHMPEMTGAELITKLRGRGDQSPAILITGRPDKAVQGQAQHLNLPLLEKPVSAKLLLEAIEKAMRSRLR